MVAPVDRPRGVLAGTFGVGILTFLLLPSEVGYQDLAALIAHDVASVQRPQKTSLASPFGTIHAANLNLPQPMGSGIRPSLGYTLAALDPNNAELTGSIRERILRESATLYAPEGVGPWVDRSRKSDQLTAQPKQNDNIAAKGDRLTLPPLQQQAEVEPAAGPDMQSPQVAVLPSVEGSAEVPAPFDIESEQVVVAEKQLVDAVEEAAQTQQLAALPDSREADQSADRVADAQESTPQVEKASPTRRAQSSKRTQRSARAQRDEQRRAERIARDARQKAEKLARSKDGAKSARVQQAAKSSTVKVSATAVVDSKTEAMESSQGVADGLREARPVVQADAQAQPADGATAKGFVVASAGDYRVGVDGRPLERVVAPASAAVSVKSEPSNLDAEITAGKTHPLTASIASADVEGTPSERDSKLFFGVDPMGKKVGSIEPWRPGSEPRAVGGTAAGIDATKDTAVKLAALPPAKSTDSFVSAGIPDQSFSKDPNGPGGQSIAPKGEVTGADQRPMTPAERLGLGDEKARAKTVKCLTEVIYFESRGEQVRGQMAVAQVVLNRAFSGKYPNTVCGVVYQNAHRHLACQFTFACDGIADKVKEPDMWERANVIANEMLDGKIWLPEVGKATHYHAHWVHPGWVREMTKLHRVGVHTFYRPRNWGDGNDAPQWGDDGETTEVAKKLVEVAKKP
jgi:spore germination cell wall hydrolase CwlJ-like protein